MTSRVSRRAVLAGLLGLVSSGPALAGAPLTSLRPRPRGPGGRARLAGRPEGMLAKSGLSGDVAWAVADVKSGLRLESVAGARALPPASVTKAVTALYALDTLGPEYRFSTRVLAAGPVQNGVLQGDLILEGGGDPTLDTDGLARLAAAMKAKGLHEVRGRFLVLDGALPYVRSIDEGQPDHVGYSPAVSGIALNYNRVHFEWRRGGNGAYAVTMDARTERYRPDVAVAKMRVVKRDLPVYTYSEKQGQDHWTVASGALGQGGARWLPVRQPAAYAGEVFATMARANGIVLPPARIVQSFSGTGTALAEVRSATLQILLRDTLKYSNNLMAEMIGLTATARRQGRRPASLRASAAEMSRWAERNFGMKNTRLVDHSGLGEASEMTADDLVGALLAVRKRGVLRPLLKPVELRDAKGRVIRNHPIKVDAKTGTLNFVSGLGGFMTAADGTELAFAIFAADTGRRAGLSRAERERPEGARSWNRRAKAFQQKLIERWGYLYGS